MVGLGAANFAAGFFQGFPISSSSSRTPVAEAAGGVVLSSRLIDGQFPNYRQLLPDAYEHELSLSGTEITEVVRRISLLAQKNAPLRLAFAEGELTVSARTPVRPLSPRGPQRSKRCSRPRSTSSVHSRRSLCWCSMIITSSMLATSSMG